MNNTLPLRVKHRRFPRRNRCSVCLLPYRLRFPLNPTGITYSDIIALYLGFAPERGLGSFADEACFGRVGYPALSGAGQFGPRASMVRRVRMRSRVGIVWVGGCREGRSSRSGRNSSIGVRFGRSTARIGSRGSG